MEHESSFKTDVNIKAHFFFKRLNLPRTPASCKAVQCFVMEDIAEDRQINVGDITVAQLYIIEQQVKLVVLQ